MAQNTPRRRILTLSAMGVSAFALMGCQEEQMDALVITNPDACIAAGGDAAACEQSYQDALAQHEQTVPRYDAREVCEEVHGEDACVTSSSGGSSFVPIMMGYMMGRSSGASAYQSKALYPIKGGGYAPADGAARFNALNGTSRVGVSSFRAPQTTFGMPPMTKATVSSRGGFGGSIGGRAGG